MQCFDSKRVATLEGREGKRKENTDASIHGRLEQQDADKQFWRKQNYFLIASTLNTIEIVARVRINDGGHSFLVFPLVLVVQEDGKPDAFENADY